MSPIPSQYIVGVCTKKIELFNTFFTSLMHCNPYFNVNDLVVIDDTGLGRRLENIKGTWIPALHPWSFSKNANLLFEAALLLKKDLVLCNDDSTFSSLSGLDTLCGLCTFYPEVGILSPMIKGGVGNERQRVIKGTFEERAELFYEPDTLCFVAVYIPYKTIKLIGFLNEKYDHTMYGFEDTDYCDRVKASGLKLGITHKVIIGHGTAAKKFSCTFSDLPQYKVMAEKARFLYTEECRRRKRLGIL